MATDSQTKAKEIYEDLKVVLAQFALKHDLNLGRVNMKYSEATFMLSTEFADRKIVGDVHPRLYNDLRHNGIRWGITEEDLHKKFEYADRQFEILGMKGKDKIIAKDLVTNREVWIRGSAFKTQAKRI